MDDEIQTERVSLAFPRSTIERVDDWRREQKELPSRARAFRLLVEQALEAWEKESASRKQPMRPKRG
jgi:hypothetical protein